VAGAEWRTYQPAGPPDRERVREQLEATRHAFHGLVARVSADDWRRRSAISAWTIGEVLVHITVYLTVVIPRGVAGGADGETLGRLSALRRKLLAGRLAQQHGNALDGAARGSDVDLAHVRLGS
jgi:hypothetical protein